MIKRFLTISLVNFCLTSALFAQQAGQAGEFLRFGVGAKALSMGRAFTAVADDASALYWNPAGLSTLPQVGATFMFMHLPMREGASYNYLAGGIPMRIFFLKHPTTNPVLNFIQDFNLGVGFVWHSLGDFEFYDDTGVRTGTTNSIDESALLLSFSYPLNSAFKGLPSQGFWTWTKLLKGDIDLGVTTKLIRQDLFGQQGSATSFDLGVKYTHFSDVFGVGLTFRDLNQASLSYDAALTGDEIPANAVVGASLNPPLGRLSGLLLSADYDLITPGARSRNLSWGVEYDFSLLNANWPIKVRIGGNSNYERFTFGLNFSPEVLMNKDWVPSGDWTYANNRSAFDATGAIYSISVDRNPFTAQYWYLNAMVQFFGYDCGNLAEIQNNDRIPRYLKNAESAKNPGDHAYRFEAALRRADLDFLSALGELQNANETSRATADHRARKFRNISEQYSDRALRLLQKDYGKDKVDFQDYMRSFIYYVQALILSEKSEQAIAACADSGKTWGKKLNVFAAAGNGVQPERTRKIRFLHALALYKANHREEAIDLITHHLADEPLAQYFLGHIAFLEGRYSDVVAKLQNIDLNHSQFPEQIYLPITYDCTFGDEVLFLRAASMFKLREGLVTGDILAEFAKIPRFFPNSDLAGFLTDGEALLSQMLQYYEHGETEALDTLVNNMIASYIKSFSSGSLIQETYTLNFR